jgi:hypothetical protein
MDRNDDAGDRIETRRLYVVVARHEKTEPARELTATEVLRGWHRVHDGRVCCDGHDTGRMHDLTARHMLTWNLQPGDTVEAVIDVHFSYTDWHCESAFYERYIDCEGGCVALDCKTVLGRPVMLGEDTADEAFGHDAIFEHVKKALAGWLEDSPCEFVPRLLGNNEDLPAVASVTYDEAVAEYGRNI